MYNKRNCDNGYCNDDLKGDGSCYCTPMSYGKTCKACDGGLIPGTHERSCDPLRGICDSGPDGSGLCKFCYSIELQHLLPFPPNISFGIGDQYGPECDYDCTCDTDNGVCYTTGDIEKPLAGKCLFCHNNNAWGPNCENECDCDDSTQYCDNGLHGTGCKDFTIEGLCKDCSWTLYALVFSGVFVLMFTVIYWKSKKHHQEQYGEPLPCCPKKEAKDDYDEDDDEYE